MRGLIVFLKEWLQLRSKIGHILVKHKCLSVDRLIKRSTINKMSRDKYADEERIYLQYVLSSALAGGFRPLTDPTFESAHSTKMTDYDKDR